MYDRTFESFSHDYRFGVNDERTISDFRRRECPMDIQESEARSGQVSQPIAMANGVVSIITIMDSAFIIRGLLSF